MLLLEKNSVYEAVLNILLEKRKIISEEYKVVSNSGNDLTKSSAGDKHEVGKAMMQLEQEKLGKQLHDINRTISFFEGIKKQSNQPDEIGVGSLVLTNNGFFYLSISLGKIEYNGKFIFVISSASPIGKTLLGKKVGYKFNFNGKEVEVMAIS